MGLENEEDQQKGSNLGKQNHLNAAEKKRLGLDRSITRRDFLKVMMVGAGNLMLSGCSGVNSDLPFDPVSATTPHRLIGGDSADSVAACHNFWWKRLAQKAEDSGEMYDLVIVGAGLGGLTAAFYYHQERPEAKILLLDSHADFGGNAQRNEMTIKGQKIIVTEAGDYQWAISPEYKMVQKLWKDLGIDLSPSSKLAMPAEASQEHLFVNGKWIRDFWETGYYSTSSPWSKKIQDDYDAFFKFLENFKWEPWPKVKKELAEWDKITYKEWMKDLNGWDPQLIGLIDMWVRSSYGAGADTMSAACAFWNFSGSGFVQYKWPGGLSGFARHLVNALIPKALNGQDVIYGEIDCKALDSTENNVRIRLSSSVLEVRHDGDLDSSDHVVIKYLNDDNLYQLKAKSVIMAGGGYMTKHIVKDLPKEQKEAYEKFHYAPYLMVNVWINNSRALDRLNFGYHGWIWEPRIATYISIADGISEEGFDPNRDPERPNCITLWCPPLPDPDLDGDYEEQGKQGRKDMLDKSFEEYETLIRQELLDVFGDAGFDPAEDIEGIAINRWGHAEVICYPGFAFESGNSDAPTPGVPIYDAGQRFGRIAFAHTDLNGFADNQGTTRISHRAVKELLD
ncbi:MAG: NAD(P)-binding protein [Anaerolineales bacterium]|nr:NAD(P)-binding protein [Anaerolineales bacterium]